MAWRIDEFVIRGEIDNRIRGRVTGRIWLAGRTDPLELELTGNAWRDVAGRRLEFTNPEPISGVSAALVTQQSGVIGDCTASRKVKVPEIPLSQIGEYYAAKKPWPWHWGNSLYLEWFSEANGRVVVESAGYRLVISPESAWEMSDDEERREREENSAAMTHFMNRLGSAQPPESLEVSPDEDPEADDSFADFDRPMTEDEAEKMHEESERLIDRIHARMEREGENADFARILEEELERRRRERGEPPLSPEEEARREAQIDEMNRAMEEAADAFDPEAEEILSRKHPLAERALALTLRLMREPEARGWVGPGAMEEHPLIDLAAATSKASAKLAGALNGEDWPPALELCANAIVRLKRARAYTDDALRAAESCVEQKLGDAAWISEVQRELTDVGEQCDALIAELRALLQRGFD